MSEHQPCQSTSARLWDRSGVSGFPNLIMLHVDKYPSKNKTDTYWKPTFAARDLPHRLSKGTRISFLVEVLTVSAGKIVLSDGWS
jgi:hypothetical protein